MQKGIKTTEKLVSLPTWSGWEEGMTLAEGLEWGSEAGKGNKRSFPSIL